MPGISPLLASSRKQIRHRSNFRKKPRVRPQRKQRLIVRVENLGFLLAFTINDSLGINS